jgi:hypothetical protein
MVWSPQEFASELTFFQGSFSFPRFITVLPVISILPESRLFSLKAFLVVVK